MEFYPARRTLESDGRWDTSGGVAILYRDQIFHWIKHKGVKTKGFNWASLHIQLKKDQELIIVTSYTKHGWGVETLQTFGEVQAYLGMFNVPWIWGGDFNRPPRSQSSKHYIFQLRPTPRKGRGRHVQSGD